MERTDWMDLEEFEDLPNDKLTAISPSPNVSSFEEEKTFTLDICSILIKSEFERNRLTLEDLTRVVMEFIKKTHTKGDFLNSIELLRFLVFKIGLDQKKIKRRMYDVLQVLSGCGILKKINRKMFFVCI